MPMSDAIPSASALSADTRVKINPDDIAEFLEVLGTQEPEHWDLIPKTITRYSKGEVPETLVMLLKHPELALAVLRCAQRRKRRLEDEAARRA